MDKTKVRFAPWIGSEYEEGFRGLRILLVCESHYGRRQYERPTVTPEIIKALAFGGKHPRATSKLGRHPHFAKIMASVMNVQSAMGFSGAERKEFWNKVAYYNFLQQFVIDSRVAPPPDAWEQGKSAFTEVLAGLVPQLIICFSSRNGRRVLEQAGDVPVAVVNHPSSRFAYSRVNPVIASYFQRAFESKTQGPHFVRGAAFQRWREATLSAQPAHGRHLPEPEKTVILAEWSDSMAAIDRYPNSV